MKKAVSIAAKIKVCGIGYHGTPASQFSHLLNKKIKKMMRFKKAATIIGNGNLQSYQNINELY